MTKHLTTSEILNFVTLRAMSDDNVALAIKVNTHILRCDQCLAKVRRYQNILDSAESENKPEVSFWKNEENESAEDTGIFGSR